MDSISFTGPTYEMPFTGHEIWKRRPQVTDRIEFEYHTRQEIVDGEQLVIAVGTQLR